MVCPVVAALASLLLPLLLMQSKAPVLSADPASAHLHVEPAALRVLGSRPCAHTCYTAALRSCGLCCHENLDGNCGATCSSVA